MKTKKVMTIETTDALPPSGFTAQGGHVAQADNRAARRAIKKHAKRGTTPVVEALPDGASALGAWRR